MVRAFGSVAMVLVAVAACGCSSRVRVMVPPQIDLKTHEIIGVIDFPCGTQDALGPVATSRFIEAARQDQGMVRFTRLGTEGEVLEAVGQSRLDAAAFKAIGEHYGVQTIVTGELDLSEVRPNFSVFSLHTLGVSADVQATLSVQMVEAATGASLWSRSAGATRRIGGASFSTNKNVTLDMDDPDNAYADLVNHLVHAVTPDFRATWTWQRE
jgi:hypothetical protein